MVILGAGDRGVAMRGAGPRWTVVSGAWLGSRLKDVWAWSSGYGGVSMGVA